MKMLPISVLALATLALPACVTSGQEEMEARAAVACAGKPTEEERMKCRDTELAAMTALEREAALRDQQELQERERREALREAYGIPKKATRPDGGTLMPGQGQNP